MRNEQHIFKPLIGTWRTSGHIRATDTSPAVKLSGTDTYEWLINESIILHRVDVKLGEDDIKSVEVIGPNANSQGYFMHSYNPSGELEVTKATIKDGVYLFEGKTARFKGGFSEDNTVFSGLWEQLHEDDWQPWMDLRLENIMTNQILFIQGAGEGAYEEDKLLAESLGEKLGTAYDVRYPRMPEEDGSTYEQWKKRLIKEFAALDREVIVVAHSVGGSLLLKYLTEETIKASIMGLFIVAAPYFGAKNWKFDELVLPNGFASKLPTNLSVFFYHSRDDQWVPFEHMLLYAKKLLGATVREFDDRGHQFNNDLSEVARDIKGLMG